MDLNVNKLRSQFLSYSYSEEKENHNSFVKQYNIIILKCLSKKSTGPEHGTAEFDQECKKKLTTFLIKLVPINEAEGTFKTFGISITLIPNQIRADHKEKTPSQHS